MPTFEVSETYELKVVFAKRFRATPKSLSHAIAQARIAIAYFIFGDVLDYLKLIREAVHAGDAEQILHVCSRLERNIKEVFDEIEIEFNR